MEYNKILDNIADNIQTIITNNEGRLIPTEDYGWSNKRYVSDKFRLAHIERYSDKNLEVLHITCFPTESYPNPIFGFDIICTNKKPLAAFMDWSPVDSNLNFYCDYQFEKPYPLPEWALQIFSRKALSIIPKDEELDKLSEIVVNNFNLYIEILVSSKKSEHRGDYIIAAQNRYCKNQHKNERTFNVLKAKIGEEKARYFMEQILFPEI